MMDTIDIQQNGQEEVTSDVTNDLKSGLITQRFWFNQNSNFNDLPITIMYDSEFLYFF